MSKFVCGLICFNTKSLSNGPCSSVVFFLRFSFFVVFLFRKAHFPPARFPPFSSLSLSYTINNNSHQGRVCFPLCVSICIPLLLSILERQKAFFTEGPVECKSQSQYIEHINAYPDGLSYLSTPLPQKIPLSLRPRLFFFFLWFFFSAFFCCSLYLCRSFSTDTIASSGTHSNGVPFWKSAVTVHVYSLNEEGCGGFRLISVHVLVCV